MEVQVLSSAPIKKYCLPSSRYSISSYLHSPVESGAPDRQVLSSAPIKKYCLPSSRYSISSYLHSPVESGAPDRQVLSSAPTIKNALQVVFYGFQSLQGSYSTVGLADFSRVYSRVFLLTLSLNQGPECNHSGP